MVFNIGLDPGFGNFKAALADGRVAVVPSVVGIGSPELGMLSTTGKRQRQDLPDVVSFGDVSYLVGHGVEDHTPHLRQRMDMQRFSDTPETRALFYATMYRLLGSGAHDVTLLIGLPVQVLKNDALAKSTLSAMRRWLVGEHVVAVNGEHVGLKVASVQAMAQPVGTYFAWGLNRDGHWVLGDEYQDALVGICDIGFNTLDLFTVRGANVVNAYTGGDTLGMRRAGETLIERVRSLGGETLSLAHADAVIRGKGTVWIDGAPVYLKPVVDQALADMTAGVLSYLERTWGEARGFAQILFTGGGATMLETELLKLYPRGKVLPDAITANALGLARYAARIGRG